MFCSRKQASSLLEKSCFDQSLTANFPQTFGAVRERVSPLNAPALRDYLPPHRAIGNRPVSCAQPSVVSLHFPEMRHGERLE